MNYDDRFQELLDGFAKEAGLTDLKPLDEGYCALFDGDDMAVQMQLDRNSGILAFFIEVGKIEEQYRAKAYPYLLAANVLWIGTGGATLGMNYEGVVMLCYSEPIEPMDVARMTRIMDNLIETAEDWEENLVAIQQDEAEPLQPPAEGEVPAFDMGRFSMRV